MATSTRPAGTARAGTTGPRVRASASMPSWRRRHRTVEERGRPGQDGPARLTTVAHGRWEPAAGRPDPVALLEEQADSRVADLKNTDQVIKKLLASYRRTLGREHHPLEEFSYVHAARKVVGVGSAGTRCYILLMLGRDHDDPLFLQVKEAQASVLERFLGKRADTRTTASGWWPAGG
jgi:hypothetical protein